MFYAPVALVTVSRPPPTTRVEERHLFLKERGSEMSSFFSVNPLPGGPFCPPLSGGPRSDWT